MDHLIKTSFSLVLKFLIKPSVYHRWTREADLRSPGRGGCADAPVAPPPFLLCYAVISVSTRELFTNIFSLRLCRFKFHYLKKISQRWMTVLVRRAGKMLVITWSCPFLYLPFLKSAEHLMWLKHALFSFIFEEKSIWVWGQWYSGYDEKWKMEELKVWKEIDRDRAKERKLLRLAAVEIYSK